MFQVAQVEASEILAGGINWAFGPFAGTTWDYRWGRVYESFSEDPTWAGEMLTAEIQGLQGTGGLGSATHLMACSKHAAGDGQCGPPSAKGGVVDRGNAIIDTPTMEKWGLAQYIPAIQAGLGCIMVSDASWNSPAGTDNANGSSMTYALHLLWRSSACQEQPYVQVQGLRHHRLGRSQRQRGRRDQRRGRHAHGARRPVADRDQQDHNLTAISNDRINDAATRILNAKCQAGLFPAYPGAPAGYANKRDPTPVAEVGSAAHRAVGRQAVQQSLVLLQNNNSALPISKTANVYLGGSGANSLNNQCGGWTILRQGSGGQTTGTTIQQAIAKVQAPVATMAAADVVVIVLSETPWTRNSRVTARPSTPSGNTTLRTSCS